MGAVEVLREGGLEVDVTEIVTRYLAGHRVSDVPSLIALTGPLRRPSTEIAPSGADGGWPGSGRGG